MPRRSSLLNELVAMHTYCRPYQGVTETLFRDRFVRTLPGATDDLSGNLHVVIGEAPILFSCHTDTVHDLNGRQTTHLANDGRLHLSKHSQKYSRCLGADDTVGVFLMRQMVLAGVPGRYVFHSGEEKGCIGSHDLARSMPDMLRGYTAAIAFDRKGFGDVITHQCGRRTAGDDFAQGLADALNVHDLGYAPSNAGLYTDTERYAQLIPECTNLSIGYEGNHGAGETVDTGHVLALLDALIAIDWCALPITRDPAAPDERDTWYLIGGKYYDWPIEDPIIDARPYECACPGRDLDIHLASCVIWQLDDDEHEEYLNRIEAQIQDTRHEVIAFDRDYRRTSNDDCALDPTFRDVQAALRKQAKWRVQ